MRESQDELQADEEPPQAHILLKQMVAIMSRLVGYKTKPNN